MLEFYRSFILLNVFYYMRKLVNVLSTFIVCYQYDIMTLFVTCFGLEG
jgi:hypothetical protein